MDRDSEAPIKVLMFPWLAHGHISPFLVLAKKLSHYGFSTYLCSTPINLHSIKNKITQDYARSIHLTEFHLESTPDFPPEFHTTNGLPRHLLSTLRKSFYKAMPSLSDVIETLKPHLIIYDIQCLNAGFAWNHNIPAIKFSTSSAAMLSYICHMGAKSGIPFPFPGIYLADFEKEKLRASSESFKKDHEEAAVEGDTKTKSPYDNIFLMRSSREIEGKYINYLSDIAGSTILPFCPIMKASLDKEDEDHELISWLGTKSQGSSVFLSFGSEYFLTKEEMEEIAFGLELSNVNFIWVARFSKGKEETSIEEALPEGFLDRIGGRGRVVTRWAPQSRILSHSSIAGFVSHCGWSSVWEAIEIGVPIIAIPMHGDQPFNARLVVEIGIGVEVKRDGDGKLKREEIAGVLNDVVGGEAGVDVKREVRNMGEKVKAREKEDLDGVVEMLKMICKNTNDGIIEKIV